MKFTSSPFFFATFLLLGSVASKGPGRAKTCRLKRSSGVLYPQAQVPITQAATSSRSTRTSAIIAPTTSTPAPGDTNYVVQRARFPYGSQKIRGVNLGGWLVLEPWITPSLFINTGNEAIVDEYTFALYQDRGVATKKLQAHWDSWITEQDFAAMNAAGLNHVRIPVPFWAVPTPSNTTTDPFITGSWSRLLQGVTWASKYDITVIIDIHCAPGSQNGYDNSGWLRTYPGWHTSPQNVQRTVAAFQALLQEFSQAKWGGIVGAIEALNEPAGFYDDVLAVTNQYWQSAYKVLQDLRASRGTQDDPNEIKMVIMDGFRGVEHYSGFLTPPNAEGVMMDTHSYQIFSPSQELLTEDEHIAMSCSRGYEYLSYAATNLWTFVGEWTSSPTDCTRWINGRGSSSGWAQAAPGRDCSQMSGRWQTWTQSYRDFLSRYFEAQAGAFEKSQGWIYWTWKTEDVDEWSYSKGIEGGWIPKNVSDKGQWRNPNVCG